MFTKVKLVFLLVVFFGVNAIAATLDYTPKVIGSVCEEIARDLYSSKLALECVDLALVGQFSNGKALNTCYRLARRNLPETAMRCLKFVNGKNFEDLVADVCTANVDNDYGKSAMACLQKVAGHSFHQSLVGTCVELAEASRPNASLTCLDKIVR